MADRLRVRKRIPLNLVRRREGAHDSRKKLDPMDYIDINDAFDEALGRPYNARIKWKEDPDDM